MNLSKERSLVLEMISDGQITVDEGEELFQALNASVKKDTADFASSPDPANSFYSTDPTNTCNPANPTDRGHGCKNIPWRIPKR